MREATKYINNPFHHTLSTQNLLFLQHINFDSLLEFHSQKDSVRKRKQLSGYYVVALIQEMHFNDSPCGQFPFLFCTGVPLLGSSVQSLVLNGTQH